MLADELDEIEMDLLVEAVRRRWGLDLRDYARASLRRRVAQAVEALGVSSGAILIDRLLRDEATYSGFLSAVAVSVTEFFRDPDFYLHLRSEIIPMLATYPVIKIWHAGCATGQEVFSLAILLEEAGLLRRARMYATDINPAALAVGRSGIYSGEELAAAESAYRAAGGRADFRAYYSTLEGGGASGHEGILRRELRRRVRWAAHDLTREVHFTEAHLIVCRNTLIYFNRSLKERVVALLRQSLVPRGYLALGKAESLEYSEHRGAFDCLSPALSSYRVRNGRARGLVA